MKQTHALASLIDEVRMANGWSDPDIAARAAINGHKLSKSNISRIRNNPVVTLNIETVSALADGLGISKAMVAHAALASMGIVTYSSADLTSEEAIRRDPTLGARDKRALLAVLAGLRVATDDPRQERPNHVPQATDQEQPTDPAGAGSDARNARPGQKTGPKVRQLRAAGHDDNNIPLPEDYLALAAHPATDSSGRREHAAGRERGEESQEQKE